MANRHRSRAIALQALFEWDFHGFTGDIKSGITRLLHDEGMEEDGFAESLSAGVVLHHTELDAEISKLAVDWPIEKISVVDRNILRIGLFELLFETQTPPKVVLNEAVELAKEFGGDRSAQFINGVLGKFYEQELSSAAGQ